MTDLLGAVTGLRASDWVAADSSTDLTRAQFDKPQATVAFTTAAPGIHRAGVVHRLDGVPVPLRAVLDSGRPSMEEVVDGIATRLARTRAEVVA